MDLSIRKIKRRMGKTRRANTNSLGTPRIEEEKKKKNSQTSTKELHKTKDLPTHDNNNLKQSTTAPNAPVRVDVVADCKGGGTEEGEDEGLGERSDSKSGYSMIESQPCRVMVILEFAIGLWFAVVAVAVKDAWQTRSGCKLGAKNLRRGGGSGWCWAKYDPCL
jgi:hypothetical protein